MKFAPPKEEEESAVGDSAFTSNDCLGIGWEEMDADDDGDDGLIFKPGDEYTK